MTDKLIIFTRIPEPGFTKTRLIDHLGAHSAANLQRRMTEKIVAEAHKQPAHLEVRYFGGTSEQASQWLGQDIKLIGQGGGDLGEKLIRAFDQCFAAGYKKVVIIGADCPEITQEIIDQAFHFLSDKDLVIGPAFDGGYYLVGLKHPNPDLFRDQKWGDDNLLANTLDIAQRLALNYKLLDKLHDIDRPEDLKRLKNSGTLKPALSVIIPTFNEEMMLAQTLEQLSFIPDIEVIVSDGGSNDKTLQIASGYGVRSITCHAAGRGIQLNEGANAATADTFLFLHADTKLPRGFVESIFKSLEKPEVVGGAFRLKIDSPGPWIRFVEKGANLRSLVFQAPYGDQGIFLRKDMFETAGRFPEIEIMEDFALVNKLRSIGKIEILKSSVITSGRRWQKKGVLKTTLINQAMVIGYLLGFSPTSLASWYRSSSRADS